MLKLKNQKGITLIALVITIIVLLILAGITITMLSSQDSAPQKAVESKAKTQIGTAKDAIAVQASENISKFYDEKYVQGKTTGLTYASKQAAAFAAGNQAAGKENDKDKITGVVYEAAADQTATFTLKDVDNKYQAVATINSDGVITWVDSNVE